MGCFDVLCCLCGNTCHSLLDNTTKNFLKNVEDYEKNKSKLHKYFKLYFAPIYEKYNKNPKLFLNKINNINKKTKWLNKCSFLTADNKIVHGCSETSCNNTFESNKYTFTHGNVSDEQFGMYGVFVHTDCWKFVKNEYNIKLNHSHLPIIEKYIYEKINHFIDYGTIEKYWDQDFDFIGAVADSNDELCYSPLKSKLVGNNIKKIISQLKIKNDPDRKGPHVSATFYKNGLYKVGINGNIWFTKNNKWMEIKDTIEYEISSYDKIKRIIYIGDINDKPIFRLNNKVLTTNDYSKKIKLFD